MSQPITTTQPNTQPNTQPTTQPNTQPNTYPRRFQCRHIFTDGHRCGSPCLRSQDLCFYHHTAHTRPPVPTVDLSQGEHLASPFTLPIPEDRSAIQQAIGEVLSRLASNQLDPRRAGLLLYGLQIASLNLAHTSALPAEQQDVIEDIVTDPDLGTVAPRLEILPEDAPRPNSLLARLLQDLHLAVPHTDPPSQPDPNPDTSSKAQPTTLPNLQACAAAPTAGWPILSSPTGKGGFRSRQAPVCNDGFRSRYAPSRRRNRNHNHTILSTAVERSLHLPAHRSPDRSPLLLS